jgi:PTS system galactitol-specific IIA component
MQTYLSDLLTSEHILVNLEVKDSREAIDKITGVLVNTGHVSPEFAEDVWKREQTFPTGLPTQPLAVALPHADPDHINRSAICIGILNSPVRFAQMGTDNSETLDVHVIFLLAIKEREKQVGVIQQLVTLIQSGSMIEALAKAKEPTEALSIIQKTLVYKGQNAEDQVECY